MSRKTEKTEFHRNDKFGNEHWYRIGTSAQTGEIVVEVEWSVRPGGAGGDGPWQSGSREYALDEFLTEHKNSSTILAKLQAALAANQ